VPRSEVLSSASIAFILYSSNIVGVACARSLHFQFFCWYYHSLPLLLQYAGLPWLWHVVYVVLLEVCWGHHPPEGWSSLGVSSLHFLLVAALLLPRMGIKPFTWLLIPPGTGITGSKEREGSPLPRAGSIITREKAIGGDFRTTIRRLVNDLVWGAGGKGDSIVHGQRLRD
jgi:ALG3 protein